MDLLYFLKQRLEFVQNLYDSTVSRFEEKNAQLKPVNLRTSIPEILNMQMSLPSSQNGKKRMILLW